MDKNIFYKACIWFSRLGATSSVKASYVAALSPRTLRLRPWLPCALVPLKREVLATAWMLPSLTRVIPRNPRLWWHPCARGTWQTLEAQEVGLGGRLGQKREWETTPKR